MRNTDCVQVYKQITESKILFQSLLSMVFQRVVKDKIVDFTLVLDPAVERVLESLWSRLGVLNLLLLVFIENNV